LRETSRIYFSAFLSKAPNQNPKIEMRGTQTGASLPQLFPGASSFLQFFSIFCSDCAGLGSKSFFSDHCNHALTKFFVLSNIRFVSWGVR
jgi:hypothetical protein